MLVCASAFAISEDEVEMSLQKVSEDIYLIQGQAGVATDNKGFISNAVFIITDDGVVVFDALGTPMLAEQMLRLIRTKTKQPIKTVIMSHYHADHLYGLQVFKELGAKVITAKGAMDYLNSPKAESLLESRRISLYPYVDDDTKIVMPDQLLSKKLIYKQGNKTFEIIPVGAAHSEGDITVLVKPDHVFLAGDLIFTGRVPFVGSSSTAHWVEVLKAMDTKNLKALVPGHGSLDKNPADTIQMTLNYITLLREKFTIAIEDLETFDDAYDEIDWSDYKNLPAFEAANRMNAYRVFLDLESESLK